MLGQGFVILASLFMKSRPVSQNGVLSHKMKFRQTENSDSKVYSYSSSLFKTTLYQRARGTRTLAGAATHLASASTPVVAPAPPSTKRQITLAATTGFYTV